MLFAKTFILSFSALATASPLVTRATGNGTWNGTGHIRAIHDSTGADVGCLTDIGYWTSDESLCGTFTAVASVVSGTSETTTAIASTVGNCGDTTDSGSFLCGSDVASESFSVWNTTASGSTKLGVVIYDGDLQYDWANAAGLDNAPTGNETVEIHHWGGEDSGWFVALNWESV